MYGYNGEVGPFRLEITPTERPSNDLCSEAIALEVGDVLAGSTALATEDGIDTCGGAIGENLSAPGLFYSVEGTGSTLIADLFSTYDMQLR